MKKPVIARDLTLKLYGAEHAVDDSLAKMNDLMTAMIKARLELGMAATVGNEALNKTGEAINALLAARTAAVAAHAELSVLQEQFGIRLVGIGPELKDAITGVAADNDRHAA